MVIGAWHKYWPPTVRYTVTDINEFKDGLVYTDHLPPGIDTQIAQSLDMTSHGVLQPNL